MTFSDAIKHEGYWLRRDIWTPAIVSYEVKQGDLFDAYGNEVHRVDAHDALANDWVIVPKVLLSGKEV